MTRFRQALPTYPARLNVRAERLDRLKKERYVKVLGAAPGENGWVSAEVEFETLESACEIVLSHSGWVRVVSPAELRDRVIAATRSALSLHGDEA